MEDYFTEMGWQPIDSTETLNHQILLIARYLRQFGIIRGGAEFEGLSPPASKAFVNELKKSKFHKDDEKCTICLKPNEGEEEISIILPCTHQFHEDCIKPWLNVTNSCPLCRFEMPTDDEDYEALRKFKEEEKQHEDNVKDLHNSMFS